MRIYTDENDRLLAVWLTKAEHEDKDILASLRPVVAQFKAMNYQPVIYCSGTGDLQENTAALLRSARCEMADKTVQ